MRVICISMAIIITAFVQSSAAQMGNSTTGNIPQITVNLPNTIPSETLTIRYLLFGPAGRSVGGQVPSQQGVRSFSINTAVEGDAALHAKLVIYAPGCQTSYLEIDLKGGDAHERFVCHRLATSTIPGFLPPTELPASLDPRPVRLDIIGELEADWICGFFMRGNKGFPLGISGSCLVPSIKLGIVGVLDPSYNGFFELTIPDFTEDPSYQGGFVASPMDYGSMTIAVRDPTTQRTLVSIVPTDNSQQRLEIKQEYSDPLAFTA